MSNKMPYIPVRPVQNGVHPHEIRHPCAARECRAAARRLREARREMPVCRSRRRAVGTQSREGRTDRPDFVRRGAGRYVTRGDGGDGTRRHPPIRLRPGDVERDGAERGARAARS